MFILLCLIFLSLLYLLYNYQIYIFNYVSKTKNKSSLIYKLGISWLIVIILSSVVVYNSSMFN